MKDAIAKLRSFGLECVRVLRVTKKPTKPEYKTIVKASAIGMALIGMLGFLVAMAKNYVV
ncbi:protein translocase SEC61 complex subunit gamma [Candidatus Woesearchaeota archaeon]|nr:protein translocase SEC61 complex subunit gamma [Candidatus Woesearchaeota archaeon]